MFFETNEVEIDCIFRCKGNWVHFHIFHHFSKGNNFCDFDSLDNEALPKWDPQFKG